MTEATDSYAGSIVRTYDSHNRMLQETTPQGIVSYSYYANGLRQTMSVQGQPSSVSYQYNDNNRLTQIVQGSATVNLTYDDMDRRTSLVLPSGIEVSYGHDAANQLTSLTYAKPGEILGNITYVYDAAGRRISSGGSFARMNLPLEVDNTHGGDSRVLTSGGHELSYDDNGAIVADTSQVTRTYVWDERQRLKSIQDGAETIASFEYDALNRRTGKILGGISSGFLNDGWQTVQELSESVPFANLLTGVGVDEIFSRTTSGGSMDVIRDAPGSTIALADSSGTIKTTYSYEPYGAATNSGENSDNVFKFTARDDDGVGLYYFRNRCYSPALGRFISQDPIGLVGGENMYAYVGGNPVTFVDPFGLDFPGKSLAMEYLCKYGEDAWDQIRRDRDSTKPIVPGEPTEAMRNAEHYLYAYGQVRGDSYLWGPVLTLTVAYDAVKFWANVGDYHGIMHSPWRYSMPDPGSLAAGIEGANDALFGR